MSTLSVDTIQGQTTAANVKFPAGSVVQVQRDIRFGVGSHLYAGTATSFAASGLEITITPKFNNSLIKVEVFTTMCEAQGSGAAFQVGLYQKIGGGSYGEVPASGTGTGYTSASRYTMGYSNQAYNPYAPMNTVYFHTCTSLDVLKFQPYIKCDSGTARFCHTNGTAGIIATEITV